IAKADGDAPVQAYIAAARRCVLSRPARPNTGKCATSTSTKTTGSTTSGWRPGSSRRPPSQAGTAGPRGSPHPRPEAPALLQYSVGAVGLYRDAGTGALDPARCALTRRGLGPDRVRARPVRGSRADRRSGADDVFGLVERALRDMNDHRLLELGAPADR